MRVDVLVVALGLVAAAGCVEPFEGSNVQIDFASGVQTNTRPGDTPEPDQPPENTHYELYAADLIYQLDADGNPVLDSVGLPLIERAFLFEISRFAIRPAIDASSPCFIDTEGTRFPGIHVTQYAEAVRADTGIGGVPGDAAPLEPGLDADQVTDVLTADRRDSNLVLIQAQMKSVTSFDDFTYPAVAADCAGADPLAIPPASCVDPASNARRLSLCRAAWSTSPDYYEGSDKVFTLPLNGRFLGMVEGANPINGGFVGGSGQFVPQNLVGLEAYLLNWQYDDLDHDGNPDVPAGQPSSPTGFPYLQGAPRQITRGTFTVPLRHATNARLSATMNIFPDLGSDDVHF